jgi:hypothetical protein
LLALSTRELVRNPLDGAAIKPDVPPELSPLQARVLAPINDAVMARRQIRLMQRTDHCLGEPLLDAGRHPRLP